MPLSHSDVMGSLNTRGIPRLRLLRSRSSNPLGLRRGAASNLLRAGLRILACGLWLRRVTFSLLKVLRKKNLDYDGIDAFHLTPAMLARFQSEFDNSQDQPCTASAS